MATADAFILDGAHRGEIHQVPFESPPLTLRLKNLRRENTVEFHYSTYSPVAIPIITSVTPEYTEYLRVRKLYYFAPESNRISPVLFYSWKWVKIPPGEEKRFRNLDDTELYELCSRRKEKYYTEAPFLYSSDGKYKTGTIQQILEEFKSGEWLKKHAE